MSPSPPYNDILEDDALAPLKRNHACLQCKKRKVKCDAVKPSCSPCLRSHAHAVRSAHRNGTTPPVLTCTYADGDLIDDYPPSVEEGSTVPRPKKTSSGPVPVHTGSTGNKRHATGQGRRSSDDDETEALKARIAELEARLEAMTTPSSQAEPTSYTNSGSKHSTAPNYTLTSKPFIASPKQTSIEAPEKICRGTASWGPVNPNAGSTLPSSDVLGADISGLENFFVVPLGWPKHLPLPFLLEHLIETFFTYVPQTPRMLHRASLLRRIKLPPTSEDFPFPGLLHAICASAANYTAWVNNLPPHLLEEAVQRHLSLGIDLSNIEDFGLAQAHLAHQDIDLFTSACVMGGGGHMLQVAQTCILIGDVYFSKGFPMKGWIMAAQPARIMAVLELGNRHPTREMYKEPLLKAPINDLEREQRLITLWMAFTIDSGFAINSNWAPSMQLKDTRCRLPTSHADWIRPDGIMAENPQFPDSPDLYYSHPVEDSFIFVVKGSMLMSLSAQWLRDWQQRERVPGDTMRGPQTDSFKALILRIDAFCTGMPSALKNVLRLYDSNAGVTFDANLLSIHIIPNIAICLVYEPFVQWQPYDPATIAMQKAYESIVSVLHLIPSNLDITLIMTPLLAFSLYTTGRFVIEFIRQAVKSNNLTAAARYQADLSTIEELLARYGQRYPLGNGMVHFLKTHLLARMNDLPVPDTCGGQVQIGRRGMVEVSGVLERRPLQPRVVQKETTTYDYSTDLGMDKQPDERGTAPSAGDTESSRPSPNSIFGSGSLTTPSVDTPSKSSQATPDNGSLAFATAEYGDIFQIGVMAGDGTAAKDGPPTGSTWSIWGQPADSENPSLHLKAGATDPTLNPFQLDMGLAEELENGTAYLPRIDPMTNATGGPGPGPGISHDGVQVVNGMGTSMMGYGVLYRTASET
ncbi:hypothetical protein IAU60_003081 [Kwoniella sp. DSM 27419]